MNTSYEIIRGPSTSQDSLAYVVTFSAYITDAGRVLGSYNII